MSKMNNIGCGCLGALVGFCSFILLIIALVVIGVGAMSETAFKDVFSEEASNFGDSEPEYLEPMQKIWMCGDGDDEAPQVVQIPIVGVIAPDGEGDGWFDDGEGCFSRALRSIRAATHDKDIRGICLYLDTPGGTVTEADILADALIRFKSSDTNRFVIAHMGSMCCSGGYYVAAVADFIIAHPTTLTGSIGVIMHSYNAAALAKKVGIEGVVIASGENKALLDPLEPVNPEHVRILKRPVDQDYERFVSIVAEGRNLPSKEVEKIADGRVLSARDALTAKLIDAFGYEDEVWEKASELCGDTPIRVYRYERPFSWKSLFTSSTFTKFGRAFYRGIREAADSSVPRAEYRLR